MNRTPIYLLPWVFLLGGCTFIAGLMHMQPVEIVTWSPHREYVEAGELSSVSVTFSAAMQRSLCEQAFELRREDSAVSGHFSWRNGDTTLEFIPEIPFSENRRYSVAVAATAEDNYGNSLAERFLFEFATSRESVAPGVVLHEPADGARVHGKRAPVRIVFSEPMDEASFYGGFSLFPPVYGGFVWNASGQEVVFTPLVDYAEGQIYEVHLERSVRDRSGNRLDKPLCFNFQTDSFAKPSIITMETVPDGRLLVPLESGGGLDGSLEIEKDEQFLLTFSQRLTEQQKTGLLHIEPPVAHFLSWENEQDRCTLGFDVFLQWNQVYVVEVLGRTYEFVVDGPGSLPPSIRQITYCADLGAPAGAEKYILLAFADNADFTDAQTPAFDFYIDHAVDAEVNIGSFLKALDIAVVPQCLSITLHDIELSPLSIDPLTIPAEGQSIVRLRCSIFDDPAVAGTVSFRVDTQLQDTAQNHLSQDYVLILNNN